MSNYPTAIDNDATLPAVNDNIDQIGGEAINSLRDAVFQIETALGTNIAGTSPSLAARLGVFINGDGSPNTSVLYSLGLVTLPVTNSQIANNAGIPESKLQLDYPTQNLFNYIRDLAKDVNLAIGWISVSGVKLEPHLMGVIYRHDLAQIDVAETSASFLDNVFRTFRDNTNAYTLIDDINHELLAHQWADGSVFGTPQNITTNNGSTYPSNYAHTASGIFLDTSGFVVIPETAQSIQAFADYIDETSILTLGARRQDLYANGISRNSQSSNLVQDGYGQPIVPLTPAIAFLRGNGNSSSPVDSITNGDDLVQLFPSSDDGYIFDEQFALVQPGDVITVNYSGDGYNVAIPFIISEKKYSYNLAGNQTYIVRIAGKNIAYSPHATAQINRSLFNNNKYGVLAAASGTPYNATGSSLLGSINPSLILGSAKGAQCTGIGFSPDQFNETHYLLYLALYPTGNPLDGYTFLPAIDVTGNQGTTPGSYTLSSIVAATNNAFRQPGYNYRFIAFQFDGEFGIMLADSYNNASFSIVSAVMGGGGTYNQANTILNFPNNVIDLFPTATTVTVGSQTLPAATINVVSTSGFSASGSFTISSTGGLQTIFYTGTTSTTFIGATGGSGTISASAIASQSLTNIAAPDPLGFGPFGANIASPPYVTIWKSIPAALVPTKLFVPLKRNNYYVNGNELQSFPLDVSQVQDSYGDGYWVATISNVVPNAGPPGTVAVTYQIPIDLSASGLKVGKTIVIQPLTNYGLINYGRYIIQSVNFTPCAPVETQITVFDAVHAQGGSPYPVAALGSQVGLYLNSGSVYFDTESATDNSPSGANFKRHFEVYIDQNGNTFTHERGRVSLSGNITINSIPIYSSNLVGTGAVSNPGMDLVSIAPKLRGYTFGSVVKITLAMSSFNVTTGIFSGFLCSYNGVATSRPGPVISGKVGEVTRFYDETNIDYVDIFFSAQNPPATTTNQFIDLQLFPSLALDGNIMILASCQENTITNTINQLVDLREFGNTSEEQFTTSALSYISASDRLLHFNGVIRGFDYTVGGGYGSGANFSLTGGLALVNGNLTNINNEVFIIPALQEIYSNTVFPINYALCVNSEGELTTIVLTDFDPILGTPNAPNRLVQVNNAVSSVVYAVDSCTFSYLLNNRKDLTILYVVSSTVSGLASSAFTTLSVRDVRRYVNDADANIPAILTDAGSQGNFQNLSAALNWLSFNPTYQNKLGIKSTYTFASDPGISNIDIMGDGYNASLIFNSAVVISNTTFTNMTLSFAAGCTLNNVVFDKCIITSQSTLTNGRFINCTVSLFNATSSNFTMCNFTMPTALTLTSAVCNSCTFNCQSTFIMGGACNFVGCTFTANALNTSQLAQIDGYGVSITNSHFNRGSVNLTNYFDVIGASSGIITNNFFDSITSNGANLSLVGGLLNGFLYHQNKNQTGFAFFNPNLLSWGANTPNSGAYTTAVNANGWSVTLTAKENGLDAIAISGSLDGIVPNGTKILNVVMGINGGTINTDTFKLALYQGHSSNIPPNFFDSSNPPTSFGNSATDQNGSNFGSTFGFISNIVTAIASTSVYCYIPSTGGSLSNVYAGNGNTTQLLFTVVEMSNTNDDVELGPILIKYQW